MSDLGAKALEVIGRHRPLDHAGDYRLRRSGGADATHRIGRTIANIADHGVARLQERAVTTDSSQVSDLDNGSATYRLPASFGQERLWVLEHLTPGIPLYMHAAVTRLRGPLDLGALEAALRAVVARHETLRTHFEVDGGNLVQVVDREATVPLRIVDLGDVEEARRETEAMLVAERLADETVDLSVGPPIKTSLVRLSDADHILVVTLHHIVSDGWSMGVFADEVSEGYAALRAGQAPALPELPIQYADFAAWQRDDLSGEKLEAEVDHWRRTLANAPSLLELPIDRPRPHVQSFDGAAVSLEIDGDVAERLRALAADRGATLFMALLAAFDALLLRYTGQDDLLVATPVAGRSRSETEGLIGFFVNTLILRVDLDGDPTFVETLERVKAAALDAYAHQELPFEKLVEELNPARDLSHLPYAQVMFVLQNAGDATPRLPGVDATDVGLAADMAPYDLTLELHDREDGLDGSLIYNVDLFDRATVEQIARHFVRLVEQASLQPERRLSAASVFTPDERELVLHGWYDDRPDYLPGPLVHESFAHVAAASPDRVAVAFEGVDVTYGELDRRANRLARWLRDRGIGPEDLVAFMFEKSVEMVIALLGTWKAGAAFVPLDPSAPAERSSALLEQTRPRVALTLERLVENVEAARLPDDELEVLALDSDGPGGPDDPVDAMTGPRSLAYVIFTSGSTGAPKGVMVEHGGLVNMARFAADVYGVTPESRFLQFMSITFDASMSEMLPVLTTGATLVLGRRDELLPGRDLVAFLRAQRVTNVLLTPSALALLPVDDLPELHDLIVCGEACPPELVARWGKGRRFVNAYGPTEITSFCHAAEVVDDGSPPPIGRPLANTRSYVLDPRLDPVPLGARGELYVGTIGLARGYLHRPDLTAERFLPDPYASTPGERIYRTGDVVRCRRDGNLDFFGRSDTQVKIRGFRVEPGEIEAVLLEHPLVKEAVVVAHDDSGEKRLVGYVAARGPIDVSELRGFLAARLPSYMVPSAFVVLDSLPHTASGKIDRKSLPDAPRGRSGVGRPFVGTATRMEETVAGMWRDVLGVPVVGAEDKFFDVGGNSLKIVELFEQLGAVFPGALTVAELFEHTTVREMARVIDERVGTPDAASPVAAFEL